MDDSAGQAPRPIRYKIMKDHSTGVRQVITQLIKSIKMILVNKWRLMNMKMKLPNKIRIGSADYEVKLVKGLASRDDVWGLINYSSTTIELEDTLSLSKLREVLAHEICHGIIHESGMRDIEKRGGNGYNNRTHISDVIER